MLIFCSLALIFLGTIFYDSFSHRSGAVAMAWLDSQWVDQVDSILLYYPAYQERAGEGTADVAALQSPYPLVIRRRGDSWHIQSGSVEFPAKQASVAALLALLSTRGSYRSAGSGERSIHALGVSLEDAYRIVLGGGSGPPLLDLLIGNADATGRERYYRRNNQDAILSGADGFKQFMDSPASWYELRLFQSAAAFVEPLPELVQRLRVSPPRDPSADALEAGADAPPAYTLSRENQGWKLEEAADIPSSPGVDATLVESYIRSILEAEGDSILVPTEQDVFESASILLELGDGRMLTLRLGFDLEAETDRPLWKAQVSTSPYIFGLSAWRVSRLFRDLSYFLLD